MLHSRFTSRVLMVLSLALGLLLASALTAQAGTASSGPIEWVATDAAGQARVPLYVFWSKQCPHCREALPFLAQLRDQEPWIEVRDFEITSSREHTQRYVEMAQALGEDARSVPAFFVCGQMLTGYDNAQGTGARILGLARFCRQATGAEAAEAAVGAGAAAVAADASPPTIEVPFIGTLDAGSLSLPLFTLVIAGLDAFNPCAFFVLLFLLSLLVHARSRARMLLIGGTFVLFSGLVYFLFMAAWLNLFLVVGGAPVVTTIAGAVALVIGGLNVKDYFWFKQGPSLSIPEGAKPGLFKRMRTLVTADRLGTMLIGTVVLALAANSYELLCTAGFPMVFTRVLTLHDLTPAAHYGYLVFYNLIYILPLLAIVLVFTYTLGTRKLTEQQGRVLKLLSGFMMLGLGLVMLIAPDLLSRPWVGALLLGTALILAASIALLERRIRSAAP
ncbi:thioredoxin family protein [uncultured Lamprocystis sp.]|uniref:glutaredoxin family protein n=1 Tax=uncultured Lamprocystis sp. TaxID=543132 RepID=UPI0025D4FD94|nr:thioredoxin family protein [uncultured Lamprocystis sp.]